jgi:outer membrane protein OmpA-like peptidoglycan-associated protein
MRAHRLVAFVAALAATVPAAAAGDALASPTTFTYTGAPQTYTVPAGTAYITATAVGARGGNNTLYAIAQGATVSADLPVSGGQTLQVYVGGHGIGGGNGSAGGWNGGGFASGYPMGGSGGGASDIRTTAGDLAGRILVAGGGGGPGNGLVSAPGGNADQDGGGLNPYGEPGRAGTQTGGGLGGGSTGTPGLDGSSGQGGTAGSFAAGPDANGASGGGGGGGGGGWFGGGGGGAYAGGGGGSNYITPDAWNTSTSLGGLGDGQVTITAVPTITVDPAAYDFGDTPIDGQSSHTFTITNVSDAPASVYTGTQGQFGTDANGQDTCSGQTLDPGASCTILVAFSPGQAGTSLGHQDGTLLIDVNASATSMEVALSGTAVPAAPSAADSVYNGQFNRSVPAIAIQRADPSATEVVLYVDGTRAGSTGTVDAGGTASITPDAPLGDGDHELTFSQTVQGYTSPADNPAPVTVTLTPPTVEFPAEGQRLTYRTPLLSIAGALPRLPVNYYVDGRLVGSQDAYYDGYAGFQLTDDLADGAHTLQASTTDSGGHEGARSSVRAFTVDTTAPAAPTVTDPADGSLTTDATPDIHVTAEPLSLVHLLVDTDDGGDGTADADGHVTFTHAQPLPDGRHTLVVLARDADGNAGAARSSTFTLDTSAPATPAVTGGPQGTVTGHSPSFEFSGEPGATFACSLDGGAFVACTSPQTYTGLSAGEHTFRVRQTDAAGHPGLAATQTFTVQGAGVTEPTPDATKLTLTVAEPGTVSRGRVPVGCRVDAGRLAACAVRAYVGGAQVGAGAATFVGGRLGSVPVKLSTRGLRLVHRVGGVRLAYRATASTAAHRTLKATGASRVLPLTVAAIPADGLFRPGLARLDSNGRRFVRSLAGQLAGAKRVICTGHTDSVGGAAANQRLGLARAAAICAQLRRSGVTAIRTVRSAGERHPRTTNRTAAGRALNRRVELLVRYR